MSITLFSVYCQLRIVVDGNDELTASSSGITPDHRDITGIARCGMKRPGTTGQSRR